MLSRQDTSYDANRMAKEPGQSEETEGRSVIQRLEDIKAGVPQPALIHIMWFLTANNKSADQQEIEHEALQ